MLHVSLDLLKLCQGHRVGSETGTSRSATEAFAARGSGAQGARGDTPHASSMSLKMSEITRQSRENEMSTLSKHWP